MTWALSGIWINGTYVSVTPPDGRRLNGYSMESGLVVAAQSRVSVDWFLVLPGHLSLDVVGTPLTSLGVPVLVCCCCTYYGSFWSFYGYSLFFPSPILFILGLYFTFMRVSFKKH